MSLNRLINGSISVCMIVRDEAERLERCLKSLQGLVDEIIVVDTGSEDESKQIAAKYTEKIFDFSWQNDFSAARNAGLPHVSSDWILQLDADNQLVLDAELFKPLDGQALGYAIFEFAALSGGGLIQTLRPLIFRNMKGLSYEGIAHENPLGSLDKLGREHGLHYDFTPVEGLYVQHDGYSVVDFKLIRNVEFLEEAIKREPDDPSLLYRYLLGLRALSKVDRSLPHLQQLQAHKHWFETDVQGAALGVLGFLGLAVLLNQMSAEAVTFFKTMGETVGESSHWADVRLAVPYALFLKREGQAERSADILKQCIRNGIAPMDAHVTLNERIAPAVVLFSLLHELKQDDELYLMIGELATHLVPQGIQLESVFEIIYAQDKGLFEHIFQLIKARQGETA